MSVTIESYLEKRKAFDELKREIERMESDKGLQKRREFEAKLRDLMRMYGLRGGEVAAIVQVIDSDGMPQTQSVPARARADKKPVLKRRKRDLKVYVNPENGEVVETRGANHAVLKAWRQQYGRDVVEGWLQKSS